MPAYRYTALSIDGQKVKGSILVENYDAAYNYIYARNCYPIDIKKECLSYRKVSVEDLLMFFLHIDLQLKCKVRINDAIESFLNTHGSRKLKSSLTAILEDLNNGLSLGEAFEKYESIFDSVTIGLLKSAEKTGRLSDIISNILKFLKLQSEWKNSVKRSIVHPIFVAVISILVLALSIGLLGPQVTSLIQSTENENIPILTQFVLYMLPAFFKAISCFSPIIFLVICILLSNKKTKMILMDLILRIPKFGVLIAKINFWQFCKISQIALDAKLDFIQALDLAVDTIKLENIKQELLAAKNYIIEGSSISESFSKVKFVSASVLTAIDIGEESSDLSASFNHMSKGQYDEILLDIKTLGQYLNSGIKLFAGLIFVLILYGLFFPIYSYVEIAGV